MLQPKKKTPLLAKAEREAMRVAGRFNAQLMDYIREFVGPGVSTLEIDRLVFEYTRDHGHRPAPLFYQGYPKSCCTSVNDVICHGIPGHYVEGWRHREHRRDDGRRRLAWRLVGDIPDWRSFGRVRAITQCSLDCLYLAIDALTPGCRVSDIGDAIVSEATRCGFSVVHEFVGHGVGREFHQEPTIPHYPNRQARKDRLYPGVCFTIEPMINAGGRQCNQDKRDGWTVRTKDGSLSAQFEHTILMTEERAEILTQTVRGPQRGHKF